MPQPPRPPAKRPKKSLGQNFLKDPGLAKRIVAALGLTAADRVLELGPGRGALTRFLVEEAGPGHVLAIEKDEGLAGELARQWPGMDVRAMDALEFPWESLAPKETWKIVGNLPYNISAKLIWDVVSRTRSYARAVFMVQREMALRLSARPGADGYGALSVLVQNFAQVRPLFTIGPGAFRPRPKVDSTVVELLPLAGRPRDPAPLARLVAACFQKRRKQLKVILKAFWAEGIEKWLADQGLAPSARPEELAPSQFLALAGRLPGVFFESNRDFPY